MDDWNDTKIDVGKPWKEEIHKALEKADVGILLVSPDFLASDFINDVELPIILREKRVFWIAVRHSDYEMTPLKGLKCANDPAHPIADMSKPKQDKAWRDICKKLRELIENPH